jgi:glycosyltransferase involved in cell wall biosynthesis
MKILQLGKFYPPHIGGIETVMYDITEVLNKKDYKTDVLCSNKKNIYSEEIINNYKVMRTKTYGIKFSTSLSPQMIFKLRQIINDYDIIHVHLPDPMANLALMFVNLNNKKIILHWHSDIIKQKNLLKFYEPFQNWLMKRADKIIATTPKYIKESKYLQKYKSKCISIPIGIDDKKLKINNLLLNKIKKEYKNKKVIFSLGRLAYYKGFKYLIESAKYLNDDYIILIGGNGPLKIELEKEININNLQNKVKLLGRITDEELANYYTLCHLFCLPSIFKSEAFGVVQIEAMSFGKPIVATNIPESGVNWVNKNNISGINVDIKNPKQLAYAFQNILDDKYNYKIFSENSLSRFNKLFKREKMINEIITLYNNI